MLTGCLMSARKQNSSLWLPSLIIIFFITGCGCPRPAVVTTVIKHPSTKLISQLEARILALEQRDHDVKRIHRDIAQLKTDISSLKNSRALTHHLLRTTKEEQTQNTAALDDKIETLKKESHRLEDAVMTLGELQKTLGDRLKKIADSQTASGLTIAMLSQSNKDVRASLHQLAQNAEEHKTGISDLRKKITELEVRFAGLSTDVMEKVASVDAMIGPELKEIRSSQTNLAQSLSLLTKKMMLLSPKVPILQRQLSATNGQVESLSHSLSDFHKDLSLITQRVGLTEAQLKNFLDPGSEINVERRRLITKLRAEVSLLQDGQENIKNDQIAEMADRTKMYKQIAGLRVRRKILVEKVAELEDAVDHFNRDLRRLYVEGPRFKLEHHILQRQAAALKDLKSVKLVQLDLQHLIDQHSSAIEGNHAGLKAAEDQQDEDRLALRHLQTKLVELWTRLTGVQKNMAHTADVMRVDRMHQLTMNTVDGLTEAQTRLQDDMSHYASRVGVAELKLNRAGNVLEQLSSALDNLRRQTGALYSAVKWKVNVHDKLAHDVTLHRLLDLRNKQEDVATMLNHYSTALAASQAEIEANKFAHKSTRLTTNALRERLHNLHRSMAMTHLLSQHQHEKSDLRSDRLRHMIKGIGNTLYDYKHQLNHAQTELGFQRHAQIATYAQANALSRKMHYLDNVVTHIRAALAAPRDHSHEIALHHALAEARSDVNTIAQELKHYKHDLMNTHAAVEHSNQFQHSVAMSNSRLENLYRQLSAQLVHLRQHTAAEAEHDRMALEKTQTFHDQEIHKARNDIASLASNVKDYRSILAKTKAELEDEKSKHAAAVVRTEALHRQMKAQHSHLGALARALNDARIPGIPSYRAHVRYHPRLYHRALPYAAEYHDDDDDGPIIDRYGRKIIRDFPPV